MSTPLSTEERRILELMKALEARQGADHAGDSPPPPARERRDRSSGAIGFDDDGEPFALTTPLPSSEAQAASNREAIAVLEALVREGSDGDDDGDGGGGGQRE
jgi:hypothetical protein